MTARYMLHTNMISDLVKNPSGRVVRRLRDAGEDAVCTSIIVAAELRYGCAKKGSAKLRKKVDDLLSEIAVLPFDVPADAEYGTLRARLEAAGKTIGGNDLLIAAHARAAQMTLITANVSEFARVEGLALDNWLD